MLILLERYVLILLALTIMGVTSLTTVPFD